MKLIAQTSCTLKGGAETVVERDDTLSADGDFEPATPMTKRQKNAGIHAGQRGGSQTLAVTE